MTSTSTFIDRDVRYTPPGVLALPPDRLARKSGAVVTRAGALKPSLAAYCRPMRAPMRATGLALAMWLIACTSKAPKRPAELGDCVAAGDASCASRPGGGGGSTVGNPDSGTPGRDASGSSGSLGCGTADSLVSTTNVTCKPCITANCCDADLACGSACQSLLLCIQGTQPCPPGDTVCVGHCENMWPEGFQAYRDLVACISMHCVPGCPALQQ
jgi:hypothetical protein